MVPNRRTSIGGQALGWPGGNERGGRRLFIVAGAAACGVIGRGDATIRNRLSPIPGRPTPALRTARPMASVSRRRTRCKRPDRSGELHNLPAHSGQADVELTAAVGIHFARFETMNEYEVVKPCLAHF